MSVVPLTKLTRTTGATQVLGNAMVVSIEASPSVDIGKIPVVAVGVVFESAPQKSAASIPVTGTSRTESGYDKALDFKLKASALA
jgi:hypothetical protein